MPICFLPLNVFLFGASGFANDARSIDAFYQQVAERLSVRQTPNYSLIALDWKGEDFNGRPANRSDLIDQFRNLANQGWTVSIKVVGTRRKGQTIFYEILETLKRSAADSKHSIHRMFSQIYMQDTWQVHHGAWRMTHEILLDLHVKEDGIEVASLSAIHQLAKFNALFSHLYKESDRDPRNIRVQDAHCKVFGSPSLKKNRNVVEGHKLAANLAIVKQKTIVHSVTQQETDYLVSVHYELGYAASGFLSPVILTVEGDRRDNWHHFSDGWRVNRTWIDYIKYHETPNK